LIWVAASRNWASGSYAVTFNALGEVGSSRRGRPGVVFPPNLLTNVTIAAKPDLTQPDAVIYRLTVAVYPTWRTSHMLLAAPLEVGDALPVQLIELAFAVLLLASLYNLRTVAVVTEIIEGAASSRPNRRVWRRIVAIVALNKALELRARLDGHFNTKKARFGCILTR
jgi:hypothetical protein